MAISPYTLKQFARLRAYSLAGKHLAVPELKMATLGYPDCLFSVEQAEEAFWPGLEKSLAQFMKPMHLWQRLVSI